MEQEQNADPTVTDTTNGTRKVKFEYDFDNSNYISNLTTATPFGTTSVEYENQKETYWSE